jgi:hypothetical protein
MKNSAYYFPHDYNARHDPKLEQLRLEIGPVGDGIYWDLVEMMYEQHGCLKIKDIPLFAKILNTTAELVEKVVKNSELFTLNGHFFYSESLTRRLKHINTKRRKAKASAKKRWDANALPTQCEGNAIKERKGKEIKEIKESKERIEELTKTVNQNHFNSLSLTNEKPKQTEAERKALLNEQARQLGVRK